MPLRRRVVLWALCLCCGARFSLSMWCLSLLPEACVSSFARMQPLACLHGTAQRLLALCWKRWSALHLVRPGCEDCTMRDGSELEPRTEIRDCARVPLLIVLDRTGSCMVLTRSPAFACRLPPTLV